MGVFSGNGEALAAFSAPARARPELWRVLLALALLGGALIGGGVGAGFALLQLFPETNPFADFGALGAPLGVILALSTFALWWPALWLAMAVAHRRSIATLFPPASAPPLHQFALGFAVALAFGALTFAPGFLLSPVARSGLDLGAWLSWLPLALVLLLIQTGAEEAVFRGYLLQQMAAWRSSPWAWAVAPSLLFGALHYNPLAPGGVALTIAVTTAGGLVLAAITARSGGIAAAWGLHFGVNVMAILTVAPPDHLSGLALWRWTGGDDALSRLALLDLAAILLMAAFAAFWFRPSRRDG